MHAGAGCRLRVRAEAPPGLEYERKSKMKTVLLAIAIAAAPWMSAAAGTTAKVEQGVLQGTKEGGLTVYKGIPFAAPPVGDLRWRAPQAAAEWKGVRPADKFAPQCEQGSFGPGPAPAMSEDCLYLNVWTPAKSAAEKVPVLVWIYGGGFAGGATSIPGYSGEILAKKGVVLVSIAYRVGTLGFLAHPELSAESPEHVSGNYGLLDMIAALQWIKKNVAAFGGDPNKVTIFGESAGGIAVSQLCASPLAKSLIQGAISESGGSFGPPRSAGMPGENMRPLAIAEKDGQAFQVNAGANSLAELRKLPPEKIVAATRGMAWPNTDGWVIPGDQYTLYDNKKFNDIPVLIGYNSDEGASFSRERAPKEYIDGVHKRYGTFADSLLKAYPAGSEHEGFGAWHGREVPYVFGHLNELQNEVPSATDHVISDAMGTYWTNFAKYGDPNGNGIAKWPAFSDQNPELMYFAGTPHAGPVPNEEGLKALDAYFAWRRSPEGARASSVEDAKPATTNVMGAQYPRVL